MKQYYYLTESIDSVEKISDDLHKAGVDDQHIHIIGEKVEGIESHHLHKARDMDETDIVRSSERGALFGIILGVLFFALGMTYKPFGFEIEGVALVMITILIVGSCTWWGGIIGSYFDNYRIAAFHQAIHDNKYLIMVDTTASQGSAIRSMMSGTHPEAKWMGKDSTIANPFRA